MCTERKKEAVQARAMVNEGEKKNIAAVAATTTTMRCDEDEMQYEEDETKQGPSQER